MKSIKRSLFVFILVFILSFNMSCDILTPLDPDLEVEKEAWDVIIEAHALKQIWFYHFFNIYSNNFAQGELFTYQPTDRQIDILWDEFSELIARSDAVFEAVDSLENLSVSLGKQTVTSSIWGALKSFFGAGKEVNENNRKRLLLIASNMTQSDRNQLYDELVVRKWKDEIGTADEFWTKLQNGDLDDKASTLYKNFYDGASVLLNPFTGLANDKKLTPGQMLAKDGINLCNKGLDVVLEAGKTVVPGLSQASDVLESGKDFYDNAEQMVNEPLEYIKDELISRSAAKIVGMTDVDNVLNTDGIGNYVKVLMETSVGSDDPQELVEKGINYGIAKITSSDGSINTDIAIAKNNQPAAGLPEFIIGVGTYAQQANEFILNLPAGNWDITARDNSGHSSTSVSKTIVSQQANLVDVTTFNGGGEEQDSLDLEDVDFSRLLWIELIFNVGGYSDFNISPWNTNPYELSWTKNSFSLDAFHDTSYSTGNTSSYETSIDGSVSLISYDQVGLYAQVEQTKITYETCQRRDNSVILKSYMDELTLNINGLPIVPSSFDTTDVANFIFRVPDGESISSYMSFSFTRTDYITGVVNTGDVENVVIQNTFNYDEYYQPNIYVSLRNFSYQKKYKVI